MPMETIAGGVWFPEAAVTTAIQYLQIDATGEKVAFIMKAPKAGAIKKIGVLTGTVTTGATLSVRIETVDLATGNPTGTLYPTGAAANLIIAGTDDNAWKSSADLGTGVVVDADDLFAVVITFGDSANLAIAAAGLAVNANIAFPYTAHYTTGWSRLAYAPIVALEYDGGSYPAVPGAFPIKLHGTVSSLNTGSNPNEIALKFEVPGPIRAAGFWLWGIAASMRVQIYEEGNDNPITSVAVDPDVQPGGGLRLRSETFTDRVLLKPGVVYRLGILPLTTTNVYPYYFEVGSAPVMDAFTGGQAFCWSYRHRASTVDPDTADWFETTTRRPLMGLIVDQFTSGLGFFDVTAYGAKGDGSNDDTTAIQAAINAAAAAGPGSTVFVPQGTYLCDLLNIPNTTSGIRLIGDGTLKLRTGSQSVLLRVSANYCEVSGIRIDGNGGLTFTGTGHGLEVTGSYNHIHDVTVFNTREYALSAGVNILGAHNLVQNTWCYDIGGVAFRDGGNYNRFQDCTGQNWNTAGFRRIDGDYDRVDLDGCQLEPGSDYVYGTAILFDAATGMGKMAVIRNTVVDWQVTTGGTQSLAKFARVEHVVLDNCFIKHKQNLVDVEIGANVKRVYLDHTFQSRQMKLSTIDSDAIIMLVDAQIGDEQLWASPNNQPTVSVEGIAGAQFIARSCRFIGYTNAALQVTVNLNSSPTLLTHFEASDTEFQGHGTGTTYDVTVSGSGAVNASRRLLWLNNRSSNSGTGTTSETIANVNQRVLFTTRDWSKKVYESAAEPGNPTSPPFDVNYQVGDTSMTTAPTTPNGKIGWVYTSSGWKTFGNIT